MVLVGIRTVNEQLLCLRYRSVDRTNAELVDPQAPSDETTDR